MESIAQTENLEARIAEVSDTITALAAARQKNRLREALEELASLKAKRTRATIRDLDDQLGIGNAA